MDNLHPTRRINVPEGSCLMKSGEPDSKFSPEIEEIDKLQKPKKLSLLLEPPVMSKYMHLKVSVVPYYQNVFQRPHTTLGGKAPYEVLREKLS